MHDANYKDDIKRHHKQENDQVNSIKQWKQIINKSSHLMTLSKR